MYSYSPLLYPPVISSDHHLDQEDNDSDGEEEPLSFIDSSSDDDTEGEEEPLSKPLPPKSSSCDGHYDSSSPYPPEFSSDGHSDQEDDDSDSSDDYTKGEEEPLSEPLSPPRPHPLSTTRCTDVHRESKLISCCAIG